MGCADHTESHASVLPTNAEICKLYASKDIRRLAELVVHAEQSLRRICEEHVGGNERVQIFCLHHPEAPNWLGKMQPLQKYLVKLVKFRSSRFTDNVLGLCNDTIYTTKGAKESV